MKVLHGIDGFRLRSVSLKMQDLVIFRFLAHSLTTFGHETAASGGILR